MLLPSMYPLLRGLAGATILNIFADFLRADVVGHDRALAAAASRLGQTLPLCAILNVVAKCFISSSTFCGPSEF